MSAPAPNLARQEKTAFGLNCLRICVDVVYEYVGHCRRTSAKTSRWSKCRLPFDSSVRYHQCLDINKESPLPTTAEQLQIFAQHPNGYAMVSA
jgi:hypothetical protein